MPKYTWHDEDNVTHVEVRENLQYRYALLQMNDALSPDEMSRIQQKLQRHGFTVMPDAGDGHAMLRVRDFKKASTLFTALREEGFVQGKPVKKEALEHELHKEQKSVKDYIKEHSIQLAGATYLFADAMPILSGIYRKTPSEVAQGGMWATTSLALLLFGRKNPDIQMANMYDRMKDYMQAEGVSIPEDDILTMEQLKTDPSFFNSMLNFLYENPILFNNSLQGLGGVMQVKAGGAQGNMFKTMAGASVASGMWSGLLIPEDKYAGLSAEDRVDQLTKQAKGELDEDAGFSTSLMNDPVAWVREKPLRLSGIGPIIGNVLTAASALFVDRHTVNEFFGRDSNKWEWNPDKWSKDYVQNEKSLLDESKAGGQYKELLDQHKERDAIYAKSSALSGAETKRLHELNNSIHKLEDQKLHEINRQIGWKFTILSPVANIIANVLYGMSSKEERSVNLVKEGYVDELITLGANVYAEVPDTAREEKIEGFAGFIAQQPDVIITQEEAALKIREKIDELQKSPWAQKIMQQKEQQSEQGTEIAIS